MKKYLPRFHITTVIYIGVCFYLKWYKEPLLLLGIIIFHEYSHLVVSAILGYDIEGITVYPFGAFLKINDYGYHEIWKDLWVASAGAFSHLLLYILANCFRDFFGEHLYYYFMVFNFQVLFFNLLPIYPMDGSKICICLLSYFLDYLVCLKMVLVISFISLIVLIYYSLGIPYIFVYIFLLIMQVEFSQSFYLWYTLLLATRKDNIKRKEVLHHDLKFYRNKQNFYDLNGKIYDEKSFIKSRIFIDNTHL